MENWRETAIDLSLQGLNAAQIAAMVGVDYNKLRQFLKHWRKRNGIARDNHGKYTCGKQERPKPKPKPEEKPKGVIVVENTEPKHIGEWDGNKIISFGLMGDTQINSKYTQLTYLHQFYDICAARGIDTVYHTGDMDEGEQMRMGHQYECYTQGADDHLREIVRVYPRREGITTYFICGN